MIVEKKFKDKRFAVQLLEKINKKLINKYYQLRKKVWSDRNIYLIYSMGKVGSSTVYDSLKLKKPTSDIFHVHFLSQRWLSEILPNEHESFHVNIKEGNRILQFIKNNPGRRIKIITLVREPVMRSISDLFQNWKAVFNELSVMKEEDLKAYIESIDQSYALNWFDSEFFNYLNVDIYSLPFDKAKGYEIYRLEQADILCLKLEVLNQVGLKAFKEFLGAKLQLSISNTTENKEGNDKYAYLKKNVRLEKNKLLELYSSKYMKHFYNESEIDSFIQKWSQSNA